MLALWSKAVRVRLKEVPTVGVEVAATTEKEPAAASLAGVVVVVVVVVVVGETEVVVAEVVVVVPVVVVVVAAPGAPTVRGAEAPNMPDELSVTSSTVVPGSTRATFTVATPSARVTLLPVVQSPWAG